MMNKLYGLLICLCILCCAFCAYAEGQQSLWSILAEGGQDESKSLPSDIQIEIDPMPFGHYEDVRSFSEGMAAYQINGAWGFLDISGYPALSAEWEEVGDFHEGLAYVKKNGRYGYIDQSGAFIIEPTFAGVSDFQEGLAFAREGELYGFIDASGKWAIEPKWNIATGFSCGYAYVTSYNGDHLTNSYIDHKGRTLAVVDEGRPFSEGLAAVSFGDTYGYLNTYGQRVIDGGFSWAYDFSEGLAAVVYQDDVYYIDRTGKLLFQIAPRQFSNGEYTYRVRPGQFHDGIARIGVDLQDSFTESQHLFLVDKNGVLIQPELKSLAESFDASNGMIRYRVNQYVGYDPLTMTMYSNTYGLLSSTGIPVHEPNLGRILPFSEGMAFSKSLDDDKLWFLITTREGRYRQAEYHYANGHIEKAISMMETLGDYADAPERAAQMKEEHNSQRYQYALEEMEKQAYESAIENFEALGDYQDSQEQIRRCYYAWGDLLIQENRIDEGMALLVRAGDYQDARQRVEDYYIPSARDEIAQGNYRAAAQKMARSGLPEYLREAYRLRYTYLMDDRIDSWETRLIALSSDGVVHTDKDFEGSQPSPRPVRGAKDLVSVATGGSLYLGLRSDGTVAWEENVGSTLTEIGEWTDVVAIAAGEDHVVALRADGTVVGTGDNGSGELDVGEWRNVIAIDASYSVTYGLLRDGTMISTKDNSNLTPENGWQNIVAFSASNEVAALRSDGSVILSTGRVVDDIEGIIAVYASFDTVVCLCEDGRLHLLSGGYTCSNEVAQSSDIISVSNGSALYAINEQGEMLNTGNSYLYEDYYGFENLYPPACRILPKEEWTAHIRELMEQGAYGKAIALLGAVKHEPEGSLLYQEAVYAQAGILAEAGDVYAASELYASIDGYQDAGERSRAVFYEAGIRLQEAGMNAEAATMFSEAGDYLDAEAQREALGTQTQQAFLERVEELIADGRIIEAMYFLRRAGDSSSLKEAYEGLYAQERRRPGIETDLDSSGWTLSEKGMIVVSESVLDVCPQVQEMDGFIACTGRYNWMAGLKPNGEVYTVGRMSENGEWALKWTDMIAIDGFNYNLIGLRQDGTVEIEWGSNYYTNADESNDVGSDPSEWHDIVAVEVGSNYALGLRADGTVAYVCHEGSFVEEVEKWNGIIELSASDRKAVGLREDGTVVVATEDVSLKEATRNWKDIVEIVALGGADKGIVGVKRDGSEVSTKKAE